MQLQDPVVNLPQAGQHQNIFISFIMIIEFCSNPVL